MGNNHLLDVIEAQRKNNVEKKRFLLLIFLALYFEKNCFDKLVLKNCKNRGHKLHHIEYSSFRISQNEALLICHLMVN